MVPPTAVALAGGLAAAALFAVNNVLKCIIKSNDAKKQRGEEEGRARTERSNFREGNCPESRLKSLTTSRMVVVAAGDRGGGAFMT